jgi:hypothetical protein
MRARIWIPFMLAAFALSAAGSPARGQNPKKDYLSDIEADKIRDAENPGERIKLFLKFAEDRLQKFQYELSRTTPERDRAHTLNGLLNAYVGCVDDAADLVALDAEKQIDIRSALKDFQTKGKEFLATLEKLAKDGAELNTYKDTLLDAIEGTRDALNDVQDAEKKLAPPPRRKP